MTSPREWVRGAAAPPKTDLGHRFPAMVDPTREILEEMADTECVPVSIPQIYEYLTSPKPDGLGLVPGRDVADDYLSYRNWLTRKFKVLWSQRGGKRAARG